MLLRILLALFFILAHSSSSLAFTTSGFSAPYGVVVDPSSGFIYVSNVVGNPLEKDGNGFISRLKGDGTVDQLHFISGDATGVVLHAPKGMEIVGQTLYVADIDAVRVFQLPTGKPLPDLKLGNLAAQHLYDLALGPDGALYAADAPANAVYRIDINKGGATVFVSGDPLGQPRALVWQMAQQILFVAGWSSGKIIAYDRGGKEHYLPGIFLRTLEGLDIDGAGNLYASSSMLKAVYRLGSNSAVANFALDLSGPTGVAFAAGSKSVIVTLTDTNSVVSYPVGGPK